MFIHMFAFRLKAGVTEAQKDRMVQRNRRAAKTHSRKFWNHTSEKMFHPAGKDMNSAAQ